MNPGLLGCEQQHQPVEILGQVECRDEALAALRKLDPAAVDQLGKQFRAK